MQISNNHHFNETGRQGYGADERGIIIGNQDSITRSKVSGMPMGRSSNCGTTRSPIDFSMTVMIPHLYQLIIHATLKGICQNV